MSGRRAPRARVAFAALLVLGLAGRAQAHAQPPRRDLLTVEGGDITLGCELLVAPGPEARALGEQLDADGSGTLDDAEHARLVQLLAARATRHARLVLDGVPRPLAPPSVETRVPRTPAALGAEGAWVRVTRHLEGALSDGTHTLLLEDRAPDARVSVPVVVTVRGARLVEALPAAPLVFAGHPLTVRLACDGGACSRTVAPTP